MSRLKVYNPTNWKDNLVQHPDRFKATETDIPNVFEIDKAEGEVFEEGTPVESRIMNNMELGIKENNRFIISNVNDIKSLQLQVLILQATVTGDVNGDVYVDNLNNLESISLQRGIFDEVDRSIYCVDSSGERITLTGYAIAIG